MTAPAVGATAHLTFLFTDIEASTRTWENRPAVMSLALARHDELLHRAVKEAGGTVFKHTGDGVCAAFPVASGAVAAALEAQRALQAEDWSGAEPLRVRMALHTGAVERRDADFFGPPLNRTARLLATAHGGQSILSLVTAELVREELPAGVGLADLGEHRLADLSRPEHIFQLTHPDLPAEFPALRSLTTRRHNLPVTTSSFIGREHELAAVSDLVRSSRLVTLVGVGGVGKTRLALQVAAGLLDAHPDGVFLVDLAPLADPELVAAQVGRAIGLVESRSTRGPDALVDGLCDHLGSRHMLLVLDNCEHLVDAVARLGDALLVRCPDVAVLATSREPLAIGGEILWRVPPLTMPPAEAETAGAVPRGDAVSLFCERARAVDAGFTLDGENAPAVARICRRLDGIPLAMELAAARIGVLSPDQVADRLDDCFRVLSAGPRTAAARQQTFRATMDWSYALLPAAEQVLLQRLSVFAGSFGLSAVEGVAADGEIIAEEEVLDLLARLVDKSLVSVRGHGREAHYRLLETVRQYAAEKLAEAGGDEEARRRHRDHYLRWGLDYLSGDPFSDGTWLVRFPFNLAYDNFRAALDFSVAHDDAEAALVLVDSIANYLVLGGYFVEGRARLEQALARSAPSRSRARIHALNMLGFLVVQQGEIDHSLALHTEALAQAREAGEAGEAAVGTFFVAARVLHQGDVERAARLFGEASEAFGFVGSTDGTAWCQMMLGWVAVATDDRVAARRHFDTALHLALPTATNLKAHALGGAALLAAAEGDGERAEALAEEGVEAARQLGLQTILVMTLTRAAEVGILLGRWEWAGTVLAELFTVLRNTGGRSFLADALEMAGLLQEVRGHPRSAAQLLGASEGVRRETNETPDHRPVTPLLEACRTRLVAALEAESFQRAWDRGGALPARDTATFALRQMEAPAPDPPPRRQEPVSGPDPSPTRGLLRREGRHWLVGLGDTRFVLPDAKGLGHLARLLAEPDREIHVLDLMGAGPAADGGSAGPVLDEQAKAAYRRRVRELEEELDEARAWNDPDRAARAELELEAVAHELAAAVGLGGRDRVVASAAERARINVRKAITTAVARIAEHHPDLGLLLSTTVKTGLFCRYTPDPRLPVTWAL